MLAAGEQNKEIAKLFQVSRIAISDIKRKTKWKWLDDECREITNMVGAVK
jgi:transposase